MDAVKEDMQVVGVRVEDTENRVKWKTDSLWRPLKRDKLKGKKEQDVRQNAEYRECNLALWPLFNLDLDGTLPT